MLAEFQWGLVFDNPFGMIICIVVAGMIGTAITTIASNWRKVREAEQEAALKQSMIEKGMSADDIVRVLKAGGSGSA